MAKGEILVSFAAALALMSLVLGSFFAKEKINSLDLKNKDVLKYNVYEKKYEYAPPKSTLRYNFLEKKWEFTN